MYQRNQILKTDADFDNAILFGLEIEVWQNGQIIGYVGFVESHTEYSVKINGERYLKDTCEFRIR